MSGVVWTPQKRAEQAERMAALVWTPDRLATLRALAAERLPGTVIADRMGMCEDSVRRKLNLLGLTVRGHAGAEWTPAMHDLLRQCWAAGTTAREIAADITAMAGVKITKGAVIGKVRRLDLPPRANPSKAGRVVIPRRPRVRKQVNARRMASVAAPAPLKAVPLHIVPDAPAIDRPATVFRSPRPGCCTWPMWGDRERPTHVYCDAPAGGKLRWCPQHMALGTSKRVAHAA